MQEPSSSPQPDKVESVTVYDVVGGAPYFFGLVDRFYDAVEEDPIIRPLYPDDLTDARRHTALFLIQYWGGPRTYDDERGHPRLRMRHSPFPIGKPERDAWLRHMRNAIASAPPSPEVVAMFESYFEQASTAMINYP